MEQSKQETMKVRPLGHYRSLTEALAMAMMQCVVWRDTDDGTGYTVKELYEFAKQRDVEHPLEGHQYYMVTREGAIGLSPGLEWLTRWWFIPMENCKERVFMLRNMSEELQDEAAVQEAVERAVLEGMKKEREEKAAQAPTLSSPEIPEIPETPETPVTPEPPVQPTLKFCTHCGAKLTPGNKFCTHCGTRLIF